MPPNNQNDPPTVSSVSKDEKNCVTQKANAQLKVVAREDATPFTSGENNSDIMSQGMGPKPMLNPSTKIDKEITGRSCKVWAKLVFWHVFKM